MKVEFIEYEFPKDERTGYGIMQQDHDVLRYRREQLNLTQQQVADMADIRIRQYQRLESGERSISGSSMRIGLSVCAVLKLDPYEVVPEAVRSNRSK